jgi:hypothetical protein
MKSFLIRPALALALAAGLAGCGGSDKAEFTVAGTVFTLAYPGLKLTTNGTTIDVAPPAKAGDQVSFAFPNKLEYGDEYNVQITGQPLHQFCSLASNYPTNADTAGRLAQIDVRYSCAIQTHVIGGTISGLTVAGLVLANGSTGGTVAPAKDATSYVFPLEVAYNQTYGVTVLTQPPGLNCSVSNPTGTMGDVNITNINVACVPRT